MHILICTLFRDSEFYLDKFLGSLGAMIDANRGKHDIDVYFLEGNSKDNTYQLLRSWMQNVKFSCALYKYDINSEMSKYQRLDILRNKIVELGLKKYHDYVLMIDSDISFSEDLLQRLITSLERTDGVMLAPMIYVENSEIFHDILAFSMHGVNFVNIYPYHEDLLQYSGIVQMDSVGDCFIVRGHVIANVKFDGDGHSEQIGFCQDIWKKGGKIYLDKRIQVYHADLPKYGLEWHKIEC